MSNIIIRKAVPEDAETIIDINIEVWNTTYKCLIPEDVINKLQYKDKDRIEKSKRTIIEKQNIYVAEVDGKIVGFHAFGKTKDNNFNNSGEIYAGYILDKYQGFGLGRMMAVACMKDLFDQGFSTLVTKCLEGNPSNEFHKSLGGIYVGQTVYQPKGIFVGKENIYYHEDLEKSIEFNVKKINNNKKNI